MQIFEKGKALGLLCLRLALAVVFSYHGYQKLFSAPANAMQAFAHWGFPPYFAYIAGTIEFFGAILLFLGLFTRVAALLLAIEMAVALFKVAIPLGNFYVVAYYELPLVLFGASLALATVGAGLLSLDAATFERGGSKPSRKGKA